MNEIFFIEDESKKLSKKINYFSIVFRVGGKNKDFLTEGAENVKKSKRKCVVAIDFAIPQEKWVELNFIEFGYYLCNEIEDCHVQLKGLSETIDAEFDVNAMDNNLITVC